MSQVIDSHMHFKSFFGNLSIIVVKINSGVVDKKRDFWEFRCHLGSKGPNGGEGGEVELFEDLDQDNLASSDKLLLG